MMLNKIGGMEKIVLWCLLAFAAALPAAEQVTISYGIDFANGEWITSVVRGKDRNAQEKITRSGSFDPEWTAVLKKYALSHPRPVITYFGFQTTFEDGSVEHGDGVSPFALFFSLVKRFDPPAAEVARLYREAIRRFEAENEPGKKSDAVDLFLKEAEKRDNAPSLDALLKKISTEPDAKLLQEQTPDELFARLRETRGRYPQEMPSGLLLLLLFGDRNHSFAIPMLTEEFIRSQSERAAFLLAFALVFRGPANAEEVKTSFKRMREAGALERFAQMVRIPDGKAPIADRKNAFAGLPERELALRLAFDPNSLDLELFQAFVARSDDAKEFRYVVEKYLIDQGYVITEKQIRFGSGRISPTISDSSLRYYVSEHGRLAVYRKTCRAFAVHDFPKTLLARNVFTGDGKVEASCENRNVKAYFELLEKYRPPVRVVDFTMDKLPYQDAKTIEKVFAFYANRRRAQAVPFTEEDAAEMARLVASGHAAAKKAHDIYSFSIVQDSWDELERADWRDTGRLGIYLRFAVLAHSSELTSKLLEHHTFDPKSMDGEDLLADAVSNAPGVEILKLLLGAGADINAKWDRGKLTRELESLGAKILCRRQGFECAADRISCERDGITKRRDIVEFLIRSGWDRSVCPDAPAVFPSGK